MAAPPCRRSHGVHPPSSPRRARTSYTLGIANALSRRSSLCKGCRCTPDDNLDIHIWPDKNMQSGVCHLPGLQREGLQANENCPLGALSGLPLNSPLQTPCITNKNKTTSPRGSNGRNRARARGRPECSRRPRVADNKGRWAARLQLPSLQDRPREGVPKTRVAHDAAGNCITMYRITQPPSQCKDRCKFMKR